MPEEEARYHMKRCVDSGLWVPEGNKDKTETTEVEGESSSSSSAKTPEKPEKSDA